MSREWQIWICPSCPMILEHREEDEGQFYCTGDGCGAQSPIDYEILDYGEYGHKQAQMEIVKVQEIS